MLRISVCVLICIGRACATLTKQPVENVYKSLSWYHVDALDKIFQNIVYVDCTVIDIILPLDVVVNHPCYNALGYPSVEYHCFKSL